MQVDDQKYYYYNSQQNFASFDQQSGNFKLYDSYGVMRHDPNNTAVPNGQFFPFDSAEEVFKSDEVSKDNTLVSNDNVTATNENLNHWFGLTMSTRFVQPKGGIVQDTELPMTYEFSGDDDVWIFVDDVLVGDLGGIHDANRILVDFQTGKVTTYNKVTPGNPTGNEYSSTTIREQFKDAGREWHGTSDTFADNSYHTLKFFYLERGNYASNMKLRFNLVTVPESKVIKVDQAGNPISDVTFELFRMVQDDDDKWQIMRPNVAEGVTDDNGELVLMDPNEENQPLSFDELYSQYGVTRYAMEERVPDGYRSAGTLYLEYHPGVSDGEFKGYVTVLNEKDYPDQWDNGATVNSGVQVTVPADIYKAAPNGDKTVKLSDEQLSKGTLFAVVLRYMGNDAAGLTNGSNWKAVSGDAVSGWSYSDASNAGLIAEAARQNPHEFAVASSGNREASIDELPGDLETYYNIIKASNGDVTKTRYTVGYYFTDGSLADASAENTYRLYVNGNDSREQWKRVFSANLHVPNTKNYLMVQKTDEDYVALDKNAQATFSLYAEDQVNVNNANGVASLKDGAQAYDTVTTGTMKTEDGDTYLNSGAVFPSGSKQTLLKNGIYYLAEDTAPEGYEKTTRLTKVAVTPDGVFADAGTKNDGIQVRSGVGVLVRTMVQYAASKDENQDVNVTLRDVVATLQTSSTAPKRNNDGSWTYGDWNASADSADTLKLTYTGKGMQYNTTGSTDASVTLRGVTVANDEGWSALSIKQNLGDDVHSANKTDLGDQQLNGLFSGATVVQVANAKPVAAELKVTKAVDGKLWPDDASFAFKLTAKDGAPLPSGCTTAKANESTCTVTVDKSEADDTGLTATKSFGSFAFHNAMRETLAKQNWDEGSNSTTKSAAYTYTVQEFNADGNAGAGGYGDSIVYSKASYTLTLKVVLDYSGNPDGIGKLKIEAASNAPAGANQSWLAKTRDDSGQSVTDDAQFVAPSDVDADIAVGESNKPSIIKGPVFNTTFTNTLLTVSALPLTGGPSALSWRVAGAVIAALALLAAGAMKLWRDRRETL